MSLNELKQKRELLQRKSSAILDNMQKLEDESNRVADVAHNSEIILDDLDREFEEKTGLQGNDIKFLFAATALQVIRIYIMNELTKIEVAGSKNRNETKLHEFQEKLLSNFNSDDSTINKPYYASMEQIVTKAGVPYDATTYLNSKSLEKLLGKNREWDFDINQFIPNEKIRLFTGGNHRFATLGHDPMLGLIFGTSNIMTNTISCVKNEVVGIPIITTNHVIVTSDYKDPRIATFASTIVMIEKAIERTKNEPNAFVASLIKQIIHIGTDMFTPCGIQIPLGNLILSSNQIEKLTKMISFGDIVKVSSSALIAEFINLIISTLHTLMYDSSLNLSKEMYNIRTRKIIDYSNIIATGSNALYTGINVMSGNAQSIKNLDIAGIMVLTKRLTNDKKYIRKIKEEFIVNSYFDLVRGNDLNLVEVD